MATNASVHDPMLGSPHGRDDSKCKQKRLAAMSPGRALTPVKEFGTSNNDFAASMESGASFCNSGANESGMNSYSGVKESGTSDDDFAASMESSVSSSAVSICMEPGATSSAASIYGGGGSDRCGEWRAASRSPRRVASRSPWRGEATGEEGREGKARKEGRRACGVNTE